MEIKIPQTKREAYAQLDAMQSEEDMLILCQTLCEVRKNKIKMFLTAKAMK